MEEIKSVRVRLNNSYEIDFKVTLFSIDTISRRVTIIPSNLPINEMEFGQRYINDSDDNIIGRFLSNMAKLNYLPDSYDIIQDPWSDDVPKIRNFGSDPYYLNNGVRVYVEWFLNGDRVGGVEWSDSDGNERIETELGVNKLGIIKRVKVITDEETLFVNKDLELSNLGEEFEFVALSTMDKDILNLVIDLWKVKVSGYGLSLCDPVNKFCKLIEYISPVDIDDILLDEVIDSESNNKESLSVVIPTGLTVRPKEDISFTIYVGQPPNDDISSFQFGDENLEDLDLLDDEYKSVGFEGEESTLIDGVHDVMIFNTDELKREDSGIHNSNVIQTGGSTIITPTNILPSGNVFLPNDLKAVQNSVVLTKQSLGKGKFRPIYKDIISPEGAKILGSNIVRDMNNFISDVLGPFSTFLKTRYPSLYKDWYITSATRGYIPKGGSTRSQHLKGQAIDSQILGSRSNNPERNIELLNAILEWYQSNQVGYGQILFETRGKSCWIHWSYSRFSNRLQLLRFKSDRTLQGAPVNTTGRYVLPGVDKSSLALA